ncbi:MAG: hypothetical protein AB1515_07710 [Nitrospirota bacterium]
MNYRQVEENVRKIIEKQYQTHFERKKLVIGKKSDGSECKQEFDLVSRNPTIIGEIKCCKFSNRSTGKSGYKSKRKPVLLEAVFYLQCVKARKKLLVLTNLALHKEFNREFGAILKGLKIDLLRVDVKSRQTFQ